MRRCFDFPHPWKRKSEDRHRMSIQACGLPIFRDSCPMVRNILLIRLSALGDVIFALPVLERLAALYPEAALTWLVEDKAASLLLHRKDLKRVVVYPRKEIQRNARNPLKWPNLLGIFARHLRSLRKEPYDMVFDFQGNLKSGIHTWLARGGKKVGFSGKHVKEWSQLFTREHITPPPHALHRIEKSVSLVDPDFQEKDIRRPDLQIPESVLQDAEETLANRVDGNRPLLVVHPGTSSFGAFKRWAPEKFGLLARRIHDERGFATMVTWGPGEELLAEKVAEAGGDGVFPAPPSPSLLHLAALIRHASAYVSADSGPLHLANYMGVPCLGLFGPKDPALYRPYFPPSRVVQTEADCSPCAKRRCDNPICMDELEVDAVWDALCRLLDESEVRRPGQGESENGGGK